MPTPPYPSYKGYAFQLREVVSHYPEDLTADSCRIYRRGDDLVVQSNTGGVYAYFTLDLTAVTPQSLVYSATPP